MKDLLFHKVSYKVIPDVKVSTDVFHCIPMGFQRAKPRPGCHQGRKNEFLDLSLFFEQAPISRHILRTIGNTHIICCSWIQCHCLVLTGKPTIITTTSRNFERMGTCQKPIVGIPSSIILTKTNLLKAVTMLKEKPEVKSTPQVTKNFLEYKSMVMSRILIYST